MKERAEAYLEEKEGDQPVQATTASHLLSASSRIWKLLAGALYFTAGARQNGSRTVRLDSLACARD
jgi:hypothetical protein